jgi:hypothetical protein
MSQYKAYTVSVTKGSPTVTGSLTEFVANVSPGDAFLIAGETAPYTVAAIVSDTELTLTAPYAGDDQSGVNYRITRDFTTNYGLAEISKGDADWMTILNVETVRKIDTALANFEVRQTTEGVRVYATLAEAQADLANIPANTLVWINADAAATNSGHWAKINGALVQSNFNRDWIDQLQYFFRTAVRQEITNLAS